MVWPFPLQVKKRIKTALDFSSFLDEARPSNVEFLQVNLKKQVVQL